MFRLTSAQSYALVRGAIEWYKEQRGSRTDAEMLFGWYKQQRESPTVAEISSGDARSSAAEDGSALRSAAEDGDALRSAAEDGDLQLLIELLTRGVDVNNKSKLSRQTALHVAAAHGHAGAVEVLLVRGADVHIKKANGRTALHSAAFRGHVKVVKALLSHGADVHLYDDWGNTALHDAATQSKTHAAKVLWKAGADPLAKNNAGKTPLSLLPQGSQLAEQMCSKLHPPPRSELQQLWLDSKTSPLTASQLQATLHAKNVTSFSSFVISHHLLLLAVRQRFLTCSQIQELGGSRDYILQNVYLPVTKLSRNDGQKLWASELFSQAEREGFIRDGSCTLVQIVADLRSEIGHTGPETEQELISIAREINSLLKRIVAPEQCTNSAVETFQELCRGQQQVLSDMQNMATSLQQLHTVLQRHQANCTVSSVLSFCFSMVPVVGGVLAGASSAVGDAAFALSADLFYSDAQEAVNRIISMDLSDIRTVAILMSDGFVNKLDPVARKRVEAVVQQTDFRTLTNVQQSLDVVVKELDDSDDIAQSVSKTKEAEIRQHIPNSALQPSSSTAFEEHQHLWLLDKSELHQSTTASALPLLSSSVPEKRPKYRIFLSHAGEDKETIARPLYNGLRGHGLSVFFDVESFCIGDHCPEIMLNAMKTAPVGVFIMSPEFVAKEWPMRELLAFVHRYDRAHTTNETSPLLIPVFYRLSTRECRDPAILDKYGGLFRRHGLFQRAMDNSVPLSDVSHAMDIAATVWGIENNLGASNVDGPHMTCVRKSFVTLVLKRILELLDVGR